MILQLLSCYPSIIVIIYTVIALLSLRWRSRSLLSTFLTIKVQLSFVFAAPVLSVLAARHPPSDPASYLAVLVNL